MNNLFQPFHPGKAVLKTRRSLPHWQQQDCTYFVTFRTADSIPQSLLRDLKSKEQAWLRQHPPPWTRVEKQWRIQLFVHPIEKCLDQNFGACPLKRPEGNLLMENCLRFFDAVRYVLDEFVVMPNHVHALLMPQRRFSLSRILHSWKSYSAGEINRLTGGSGKLWGTESFDHIVRSAEDLERFRIYIRNNPVKANLKEGEYGVGRGSGLKV